MSENKVNSTVERLAQQAGFVKLYDNWYAKPTSSLPIFSQLLIAECLKEIDELKNVSCVRTTYEEQMFNCFKDELKKHLKEKLL